MGMAQGSKKGRMLRNFVHSTVFGLGLALAMPAHAQQASDQTLADIRRELTVLYVELQRLQRELSTTGAPSTSVTGQTTLARLDAIEAELQRLTAKTERLEFRVGSVVRDGTSRIGDLEFRLCELEPACDIASLGETPLLGGVPAADAAPAPAPSAPAPTAPVTELAIGEQADFDRARALLDAQDYQAAAQQFATFAETYPGGPLSPEAHLRRGEALDGLGQPTQAARAYLEAFSADQTGPFAPEALYRLGEKLGALGQTQEACVTLGEVVARFPQAPAVGLALEASNRIGCP